MTEKEAKRKILQRYRLSQKIKGLEKDLTELNSDILTYMKEEHMDHIIVSNKDQRNNGKKLTCTLGTRSNISFDIEKLEKKLRTKLEKTRVNKVIKKTYIINDWQALIMFMERIIISAGFNRKEFIDNFLELISVEKSVDKNMLEQLEAIGKIAKDDIEGTYSVTTSNYISIRETKPKGD